MSLSKPPSRPPRGGLPGRQCGVVLMVALIILVAMTLAGVALIRSVDTANVIAGNLSFRQSATGAGERGTEVALATWLAPNSAPGNAALYDEANQETQGYFPTRSDPAANQSWDAFWNSIPANQKRLATAAGASAACPTDNSGADLAGNTVCYVVHRLCENTGKPNTAINRCTQAPPGSSSGESAGAGKIGPAPPKQVYYRITTRIRGPRNTVSYIQTIVAL